jgi:hypothetical protein
MTSANMPTKPCTKCGVEKPLTAFNGRQKTCVDCVQAAKVRTLERKEAVAYSLALSERICDLVAMGSTITDIAVMSGMPTARQIASWRRQHLEFQDAYEQARESRADARSDRVDQALNDLRAGKITAADCRVIVETELKMAGKENPARFGDRTVADVTVRPGAPADKPNTAAWLDKVLGVAIKTDNVIPLLPAPKDEEDAA